MNSELEWIVRFQNLEKTVRIRTAVFAATGRFTPDSAGYKVETVMNYITSWSGNFYLYFMKANESKRSRIFVCAGFRQDVYDDNKNKEALQYKILKLDFCFY